MKQILVPILALIYFVLVTPFSVMANDHKEVIVALSTSESESIETDISSLAIGESKTIETENGKMIDILRTSDGAEIYMDGALLEMNADHGDLHDVHKMQKHVEVICDDEENCEKNILVLAGDDFDLSEMLSSEGDNVIFHKEIRLSCTNEEEGTSCSDENVWISDDGNVDIEEFHQTETGEKPHKVIVIKKETLAED